MKQFALLECCERELAIYLANTKQEAIELMIEKVSEVMEFQKVKTIEKLYEKMYDLYYVDGTDFSFTEDEGYLQADIANGYNYDYRIVDLKDIEKLQSLEKNTK